jgi:hypothetical protein
MVAVRWACTTARTSTPGTVTAIAILIASSSRGGLVRLTGVATSGKGLLVRRRVSSAAGRHPSISDGG